MSRDGGSRKARYISAAVAIPLGLAICLFSATLFNLLVIVLTAIGATEFYAMSRHRGFSPHSALGVLCTIAVCIAASVGDVLVVAYTLVVSITIICTLAMTRGVRDAIANIAVTVFGILYVGWFCSHIILLRLLPLEAGDEMLNFGGAGYVIMLLILLWLDDGGAFFAGTAWGRRKLIPAISPNKTIEGSVGGIFMTLVGALLVKDLGILLRILNVALFPDFSYRTYLLIGLGVGVLGQVGDLCESYLKRDAGLKDTGNLLPGHGGFLDRFDSLILTAPLFYYLLRFMNL